MNLEKAYASNHFRTLGHQMVDLLADYLEQLPEQKVLHVQPPEELYEQWSERLEQGPHPEISWLKSLLRQTVQVPHPHYMGHQISPPVPLSALMSLVDGLVNNGMGVYEMGQAGTVIERLVVKHVAKQMGFTDTADGVLTSGGSLGNLTALLTARSRTEVWEKGSQSQLALMVSEEAHYCVSRAVKIMGWGSEGIIKVPVDQQYRMKTELLAPYLQKAREAGKKVIAVVGSACSTSTGSFDNLEEIAAFCKQNDLWFHVDAAHGGGLCFSSRHKQLLNGIEQADSVVMDFHKMLLTPSVATALIYKNGADSYRAFQTKAEYLWEKEAEQEWHNLAKRTFECTKLMMGLKVYSILQYYGPSLWEEYLDKVMENGQILAQIIEEHPEFELATWPSCNIVCFRYVEKNQEASVLNQWNTALRKSMLQDGTFYIVQTTLDGKVYLRTTLTNPFTTARHIGEMVNMLTNLIPDIKRAEGFNSEAN